MHMLYHCVTVVVCVTFQSVHVAIENANASHMHAIPVVLNQVQGTSSIATFKGVCGTVWKCERIHIHIIGDTFWPN